MSNSKRSEVRKIFIDTNIYLGFFNSNKPEFKKLLSSLIELGDKILVTDQIINEINRNKLQVFIASINNYIKQTFVSTLLPEHLDYEENPKLSKWNTRRKRIARVVEKSNSELMEIINQTLNDISKSKDKVSTELSKLFLNPLNQSAKTYESARIRKEVGNPPGKYDDPFGDQLNWVSITENLKNVSSLWIVSNDHDFFNSYDENLFLNPLLYEELLTINPKIEVFVFNKLSDALRDFSGKEIIKSLPPTGELEKISNEEPFEQIRKNTFFGGGHAMPLKCPNCGIENSFSHGSYLRSKYGGHTYQYVCTNCGFHYDTGAH